jgi:hypothetical protein
MSSPSAYLEGDQPRAPRDVLAPWGCGPVGIGGRRCAVASASIETKLWLEVQGATEQELQRGVAAAQKLLDDAGVSPSEAEGAAFKRDSETMRMALQPPGAEFGSMLTERDDELASLWEEAERVALQACCSGWSELPKTDYSLRLVPLPG